MHMKTTMKYYIIPMRIAVMNKTGNKSCQEFGETGNFMLLWEHKMLQPLWKIVWQFLKKLITKRPYDPTIPLLDIDPREMKTRPHKDLHGNVHCNIVHKCLNAQAKCPLTDEWIGKLWSVHTIEYYSVMKRNEILTHAST